MPRAQFRPSWLFRARQLFLLPWRLVCVRSGHAWHNWACTRCLAVDEMRLAFFHINRILDSRGSRRRR